MSSERDPTAQTRVTRPSRQIAPTSKLTDVNNIAQPELSFQRRAVQAFRTRAQDASSSLDPLVDTPNRPQATASSSKQKAPAIANADCPTASSSKQKAPAIADAAVSVDTDYVDLIDSGGDEDELMSGMPIFRHYNLSYLHQNRLAAKAVGKQRVILKTSKRKRLNDTDEEADVQDGEPDVEPSQAKGMGILKYAFVLSETSCSKEGPYYTGKP